MRELFVVPGQRPEVILRSGRLLQSPEGEIIGRFGGPSDLEREGIRREKNTTRFDESQRLRPWPDNGFYRYFQEGAAVLIEEIEQERKDEEESR